MNKKSQKLGMSHSTANYRLLKMILFMLLKESGKDYCYRCNKKITDGKDLSIEHKEPWLNSLDPKKLYFDLDNISFSHIKCNSRCSVRPKSNPHCQGSKHWNNKLSETDVHEIRRRLNAGETLRFVADYYGVSHTTIGDIAQGKTWLVNE